MMEAKLWEEVAEELKPKGYTLEKLLSGNSSASMTAVWLATYNGEGTEPKKRVLKISSRLLFGMDAFNLPGKLTELAQRESDIMRKIDHPNIPCFLGLEQIVIREVINLSILATEYVEMPNLQTWVDEGKRLTETQVRRLLEDSLAALDYLHTKLDAPVLHRDIKPSNILFNGEKAFVFDFNFASVGEKTNASTVVDNFGYYPPDAYSGRQTTSQDLAALGYVAIAASYGKAIAALRVEQGKGHFDELDVAGLPFSSKLKQFLRKMTNNNPAQRYQTARQALGDLKNLDSLTEEEVSEKLVQVTRSEGLTNILNRLKAEDEIFDYNVPPSILQFYDDDALLAHLDRTYSQEEFVVDGPDQVKKYITIGDRVVKKGTYNEITSSLKRGTICVVEGYEAGEGSPSPKLSFSVGKQKGWSGFDASDFVVVGKKNRILPDVMFAEEDPKTIKDGLKKGHILKYIGEDKIYYKGEKLPDGTEGLVAYEFRGSELLHIIWARGPGVVQVQKQTNYNDQYGITKNLQATEPGTLFNYIAIKLVRPNNINYLTLRSDCMGQSGKIKE